MNMKNKKWEDDFSPVDPVITPQYSKAYLRHLVIAKEYMAAMIASRHNLAFYTWLTKEARKQIEQGTFSSWKDQMVAKLNRRL